MTLTPHPFLFQFAEMSDSEDQVDKIYVVGYCDEDDLGKKDAEVRGPFYCLVTAEANAKHMTIEYYSKNYFDRVVLVFTTPETKLYRHEVMKWETDSETWIQVWSCKMDGELKEIVY